MCVCVCTQICADKEEQNEMEIGERNPRISVEVDQK